MMAPSEIKIQGRKTLVVKLNICVEKYKDIRTVKKKIPQQAGSAQNDSDSPLLRLPGELRNQIYDYVIGGHEASPTWKNCDLTTVILDASLYNQSGESEQCWAELFNLSYVCKQLNMETRALPYKLTVFQVQLGDIFRDFLRRIKKDKKQLITTISFGLKSCDSSLSRVYHNQVTTPVELYECSGVKTVISRTSLDAVQKRTLKRYAEDMGATVIYENNHLEYVEVMKIRSCKQFLTSEGKCYYRIEYEDEDEE